MIAYLIPEVPEDLEDLETVAGAGVGVQGDDQAVGLPPREQLF